MLPTPLVFLDTETTGLSVRRDRIIEVGLIRVENDVEVARYQTLINPQTYISPVITDITSIKSSDLESAPEFGDVASTLFDFLNDAVLVAHNARFDYGFLRAEFLRIGKKYTSKQICSAKLSRMLFPQYPHHNLDSIIERFDISVTNRHRAFDDAQAIWDFFTKLKNTVSEESLDKAVTYLLKHSSLPRHLSHISPKSFPERPGVYIFFGENDIPLYVGKSINVKERILSHFANDYKESKEMHLSQQVKRIETIPTAGELGALLKESELIKSLQPIYNRKLRQARRLIVVKEVKKEHEYTKTVIEDLITIDPEATSTIITTAKSKKQAQEYLHFLADEYTLCKKLLGLEKGRGACFAYRLGRCKGACVSKENYLSYNMRCIIAFSKKKIKSWPFVGPVILREEDPFEKTIDEFWVDKWCLLGKRTHGEDSVGIFNESDYRFDMDTYKILLHFIDRQYKKKTLKAKVISEHSSFL